MDYERTSTYSQPTQHEAMSMSKEKESQFFEFQRLVKKYIDTFGMTPNQAREAAHRVTRDRNKKPTVEN
jgi:hypothetical protein